MLTEKDRVRCCDCAHRHQIVDKQNLLGDKFCPVPINGVTLVGGANNGQALKAWRKCTYFEKDEKET